ncbi:hypothetical protein D3C71_77640 [compost metagenome]
MSVTKVNPVFPLFTVSPVKSNWPRLDPNPVVGVVVRETVTRPGRRIVTEQEIQEVKAEILDKFQAEMVPAPGRIKRKKKPATMFVDITQGKPARKKKPYQGKITPQCQSSSRYDMLDFEVHVYGPMDLLIRDLEVEFDVGFGLVHEND